MIYVDKKVKDLSIIIVNWNAEKYMRKCLQSVIDGINNLDYEIIVVDNASYDGSEKIIRIEFPSVIFVQSERNIGFAGANNLGYQYSKGNALLFLNPDTEIVGSAVTVLYSYLQSLPQAGALGCKLLNTDLTIQTSCIQSFPTILNQALDIEYLRMRFPKLKLWGIKPLFFNNGTPNEVDVISGACFMIRRRGFESVNMFTTDYFMYSEDVDLCYKIRRAGYKNYYIGDAGIIHHGGGCTVNTRNNFPSTILMRESRMIYFKKTKGNVYANLYRLTMLVMALNRLIVILILLPFNRYLTKTYNMRTSFRKWKKVLRWSFGLETVH